MSRVLVVGLDVGDGHLARAFAAEGAMPRLARLLAEGAWADLATPAATLHVAGWPSLYTGTSPGQHGVYYTHQPAPGVQGAVRFHAGLYGRPTLWELGAAAGARCTVFDAPYTGPARDVCQILEWGTWAHYVEPAASPPELGARMRRACGAYPLGLEANRLGLAALDPESLASGLVEAAAAKGRAARWLAAAGPFDLFVAVFGETHPAAHSLWPRGRRSEDVRRHPAEFDAARRVYAAVDAALGELLDALADVDHVLVVSADGAGPNHAGWHLLPAVLERAGFQVPPGSGGTGRPSLYGRLRRSVPPGARAWVSRHLPARVRERLGRQAAASQVDWSRTRAYCLPTDLEGCVRVNLRGREPQGIVPPEDFDAVCADVAAAVAGLVDPRTGRPAVREVVRVADAFPGPRTDWLPDLVVLWDDAAPLSAVAGPGLGTVAGDSPDHRTGTHRPPGFLVARGAGFAPGARLTGARVVDVAPTVLHLLGVAPPDHFEGRNLA